jgi:hypothetical protein
MSEGMGWRRRWRWWSRGFVQVMERREESSWRDVISCSIQSLARKKKQHRKELNGVPLYRMVDGRSQLTHHDDACTGVRQCVATRVSLADQLPAGATG